MRSGEVVPPKLKGGTWGIRFRLDGKRYRRGGFATEDIARRVLAKLMGDLAHDRAELPRDRSSAPTLEEEAASFFERRKRTHRAGVEDHGRWKKHLRPFFGRLPKSLVKLMKPTYDPRTTPFIEKLPDVRRIFMALRPPLNVAYAAPVIFF